MILSLAAWRSRKAASATIFKEFLMAAQHSPRFLKIVDDARTRIRELMDPAIMLFGGLVYGFFAGTLISLLMRSEQS